MSATEKLLKVTNQIGDLRYKLSHPDYFNLSQMERARSFRQLAQLSRIVEMLESLRREVQSGSE